MQSLRTWRLLLLSLVLAGGALGADWPAFRGANGSGVSEDDKVPTQWDDKKNLKWKLELPGRGYSSPIVVGDKVFVTCYTGERNIANLKRQLVCVDRASGKELWSKTVPAVQPEFRSRGTFGYHGYASSTPAADGDRVYVHFGTTGVLAFDMKGEKLWQQSVGTGTKAMFGSASSVMLYKDLVIVTAASENATIYALDKKTGKEVWKATANSLSSSYSTPSVVKTRDGEEELVVSVAYETWGLNPTNGKLKWYAETNVDDNAIPSIVSADGIAYVVGGHRPGGHSAIKAGGTKDVTKTHVLWTKRNGSYVSSPVLYKGYLFWVGGQGGFGGRGRGFIVCTDAKTGEEKGRKEIGGDCYASLVVIKDKLYAVTRSDGTYVLEATPKMEQVAHNKLDDTSEFNGTPAVSNGQLFLRSDKALYCIQGQ